MKRREVQKNNKVFLAFGQNIFFGLRPKKEFWFVWPAAKNDEQGDDEKGIPKGFSKGTLKSISRRDAAERRRAIYLTQLVFFIAKLFWWCCCACYLLLLNCFGVVVVHATERRRAIYLTQPVFFIAKLF